MSTSRSRVVAVTAASTGLAAGLALGVTGLASATPTATPTASSTHSASGSNATAHHGRHGHDRRWGHGGDLVTAVTAGTISVDTPRGQKTLAVTPTTVYRRGGKAATFADLKPNEIVRVRLVNPKAVSPVAKTVDIEMARTAGYVTAVDGQSFTVVGLDGFARIVTETSATIYRNAGKTGSASEVTVGKFIRAAGTVGPDGTTLDATQISTGHSPRTDRQGGHMPMTGADR